MISQEAHKFLEGLHHFIYDSRQTDRLLRMFFSGKLTIISGIAISGGYNKPRGAKTSLHRLRIHRRLLRATNTIEKRGWVHRGSYALEAPPWWSDEDMHLSGMCLSILPLHDPTHRFRCLVDAERNISQPPVVCVSLAFSSSNSIIYNSIKSISHLESPWAARSETSSPQQSRR